MQTVKRVSRRIITLDLLRGWFLVAILFDHLQYYPNGFDLFTGRGSLFVSAAEGFFLISGIVLGIVRGSKLIDKPFSVAAKLLLKRGVQLYITAIVLFFIFTFIGWLFIDNPGLKPGIRPPSQNFFEILRGALTFDYIYGWADYLRLYAMYLLASPIVMWLLRKRLWYVVILASVGVWMTYDISPLPTAELSQVFSWQIIFYGGMIIGFHLEDLRRWWMHLAHGLRRGIIIALVTATLITAAANLFIVICGDTVFGSATIHAFNQLMDPFFNKERLPFARIGLFLLWFFAGFWFFFRFEKQIMRWLGWILVPFGTNSLYIYTIEAFVIFFIHLLIPAYTFSSILVNFALSVACLMIVWLAVRYKFLMKIIPR